MKKRFLILSLLLFLLGIWPRVDAARAATPGAVAAWGANDSGQTTVPVAVQSGVVAIAVGGYGGFEWSRGHTVALKTDGSVIAWGANDAGQVTGTPGDRYAIAIASPVTLGGQLLSGVTALAAGDYHTVALKNDGSVVAWGWNRSGEVTGAPATEEPYSAIANPVSLGGQVLSGVTAIAAGEFHTVALKSDGTVVAWGRNDRGQVTGTDDFTDSAIASPVTLGGQIMGGVVAIAAGRSHTVALKSDGSERLGSDLWSLEMTGTERRIREALPETRDLTPSAASMDDPKRCVDGFEHGTTNDCSSVRRPPAD